MGSKNRETKPKIKRPQPRDLFAVTPGWKINKLRYRLFRKACETENIKMIAVINRFLDHYIAHVFGPEILEQMNRDIIHNYTELKQWQKEKPRE